MARTAYVRPTEANRELGRRLHGLRIRRDLTLRAVSRKTGLARSFISAIEQRAENPSVASLQKLARCYGTTVAALTAPRVPVAGKVIRAGHYRLLPMLGKGIKIEQLNERRWLMDCSRYTLSPGAASQGTLRARGRGVHSRPLGPLWDYAGRP